MRGIKAPPNSADTGDVQSAEPITRSRVAYPLKRHGRQLLVISEDDVIFLSPRVRSSKDLQALTARVMDSDAHVAVSLGPSATIIPVAQILETKVHGSRGYLDIETRTEVHRIAGWSQPPLVRRNGVVKNPTKRPTFGTGALTDVVQRITQRRLGVAEDDEPLQFGSGPEIARALEAAREDRMALCARLDGEIPSVSFVPLMAVLEFFRLLSVVALLSLAVAVSPTEQRWLFAIIAAMTAWSLSGAIPGPMSVRESGIVWGRWRGRRVLLWSNVERVEFADRHFGRERIFVVDRASKNPLPLPHTKLMSRQRLATLRQAMQLHRPCVDQSPTGEPAAAQVSRSLRSLGRRRTKPTILNAVANEPRRNFWFVAVPLAIVVPLLLMLPIIIAAT